MIKELQKLKEVEREILEFAAENEGEIEEGLMQYRD